MIVAVPSETDQGLNSIRSGHFGHTPYFTLVTVEDGKITDVKPVKNIDHDTYGCGGVIEFALQQGIDAMITVGMGRPPLMRFTEAGVKVYAEGETPMVGDVVQKFLDGKCQLMSFEDACNHH